MYIGNTDVFEILSGIISFIVALRSFWLFARFRGYRVLILGLSMFVFALTTMAGIARNVHLIPMAWSTTWFSFAGQTAAFAFIFLSSYRSKNDHLRILLYWQIVSLVPIFLFLPLAPVLPAVSDALTKGLFIGIRALVCFLTFYSYMTLFTKKQTRFCFFMMIAFLALGIGYVAIIPKYFLTHVDILTIGGDIIRVLGLVFLGFALLFS